jgi:hypothetical protein
LNLAHAEDDPIAVSEIRKLVAVATLGVEYNISVVADRPPTRTTLCVPLRVLESFEEEGDGGISALVERLAIKDESEGSACATRIAVLGRAIGRSEVALRND